MLENPYHYDEDAHFEEDARLERAYLRRVVGVALLGVTLLSAVGAYLYYLAR